MTHLPSIGLSGHPLIAIPPYGYGAVEKILYQRALLLETKGFETHIISRPYRSLLSLLNRQCKRPLSKKASRSNLSFHYCSFPEYISHYFSLKLGHDSFYKYIGYQAKMANLDIIHTSYPPYAEKLKQLLPSTRIITEVTTSIDEEQTKNLGELSEKSDLILTVSNFVAQYIKSVTQTSVETLYNAVDSDSFYPSQNGKQKIILCSGKIMRWKGQHVLLDALRKVDLSRWKAYFVGLPVENDYYHHCAKEARSISKNIKFLGYMSDDDLRNLYGESAIFVCPSIGFEAFGVVNIEAMSSGCAVVASRSGGIPEIIEDQKTGLLVRENDSTSLAESLTKLMDNEDLRHRLGDNSRSEVLKRFTYSKHVDDLIGIYKKYGFAYSDLT